MITSSLWGSTVRTLLLLRRGSDLSILPYSSQDGKEAAMILQHRGSLGEWQEPRCYFQIDVLLPATPVTGKGDPGALTLVLAGGAQPLHQGTFRLSFAMHQHPRELHISSPVNITSHPTEGCSKIQAWMVPEDTQHKQEFMPIFGTAWLFLGLIPHRQNKILIPFSPSKAELRSSLCLCSVFMCNRTEWQEPFNAYHNKTERHREMDNTTQCLIKQKKKKNPANIHNCIGFPSLFLRDSF